ncbi:hypothetical protein OKW22_001144 [Bacilli bacterium PM5-3]|nr:hypothetical protein [Bacilli bacterium PM5-3]MDH6603772.1 hypothetical protein [Bacilli bacterium PM5-9]
MKLIDSLKKDTKKIEFYGARKPKYNKEEQAFFFENDSLVALSTFDDLNNLNNFYEIIKNSLIEKLDDIHIKDYSNDDNFAGFAYLDQEIKLNYQDSLNEQTTSISLLEKESLSFSYILIKVINEDDEILIWVKLKSPLKIENNTFYYNPDDYEVKITKDGLKVSNYPAFKVDVNLVSFIYLNDDFYILDKELYQKYFNLETYYDNQASQIVYNNPNIISDGQLLTKGSAKLVCEYFEQIDSMCQQINDGSLSKEKVKEVISFLNLSLEYNDDKFILKRPKDLMDLLLLSNGCLGINSLTNTQFKVKRPQYLADE